MPQISQINIDEYNISLYAPEEAIKGKVPRRTYSAEIVLYGKLDDVTQRIHMYFVSGCLGLPANERYLPANTFTVYISGKYYKWYLDLLRNEKPVRAIFVEDPGQPIQFWLETGQFEPVGEGE